LTDLWFNFVAAKGVAKVQNAGSSADTGVTQFSAKQNKSYCGMPYV